MKATKEELATLTFNYELYYLDCFCDEFNKLENAIKRAKETIKHNPECKGGYRIFLDGIVIAIY